MRHINSFALLSRLLSHETQPGRVRPHARGRVGHSWGAEVAHADHRSFAGPPVPVPGSVQVTLPPARRGLIAERDGQGAALLERLLRIAFVRLPEQHTDGEFVFTVTGTAAPGGGWLLQPAGTSLRYGAITALGLLRAPEPDQRRVL